MKCSTLRQSIRIAILGLGVLAGGFFSSLRMLGAVANPGDDLNAILSTLPAGGTLTINAGTYPQVISKIPAGVNLSTPTLVQAAPGATVVVNGLDIYNRSFITVRGIITNGYPNHIGRTSTTSPSATFITLENVVARNWVGGSTGGAGFNVGFRQEGISSNIRLINCSALNNGSTKLDHGVYISSRDNLIDGGKYSFNFGHGIHVYSSSGSGATSGTIIRNAEVSENGSFGIGLYSGSNLTAQGNRVFRNGRQQATGGIAIRYGGSGLITKNTVTDNGAVEIWIESGPTLVENNCVDPTKIKNTSGGTLKNNSPTACGGTTAPPPPTDVQVSQTTTPTTTTSPPVYQPAPAPDTSQPSGLSTSSISAPFLIAAVILAALVLGD